VTTRFTAFDEYEIGIAPGDWHEAWNTSPSETWVIREKAGTLSGKCLEHTASSPNTWRAYVWDAVGQITDVNLVTRVRMSYTFTGTNAGLRSRFVYAAPSATGYTASINPASPATLLLERWLPAGPAAVIGSYPISPGYAIAGALYYIALSTIGSDIKAKAWKWDEEEPDWQITVTNSEVPGPGLVGVGTLYYQGIRDFDLFGIGTNGDPAPTEPVNIAVPRRKWRNAPFGFIG
jgi:hypothetical protein